MRGSRVVNCDLSYVNFSSAKLAAADLVYSLLHATIFRDADLVVADFTGSYLTGVDTRGANTRGAIKPAGKRDPWR